LVTGIALLWGSPAFAAKWRHCPEKKHLYRSELGYFAAPFVHPGHQFGIYLPDNQLAQTGGGFSTKPYGNRVLIMFASLFGFPVVLPSFNVAAVSPATLYFTFPDTRALNGGALAGPVDIRVITDGRETAHILPRHLVALPPSNDVAAMVAGAYEQSARAAMDAHGAIWIPVQFSAFGTMEKQMPGCSMPLTPITGFTVDVSVRSVPAVVTGAFPGLPPLRALRTMDLYLGDFLVNGVNIYGLRVGRVPVARMPRGWGITICGVNDAVDLVLQARGWRRWAQPWSPFGAWMPNSRPLDIVLRHVSATQSVLTPGGLDAFGEECALR
jgi:hypothetical protein